MNTTVRKWFTESIRENNIFQMYVKHRNFKRTTLYLECSSKQKKNESKSMLLCLAVIKNQYFFVIFFKYKFNIFIAFYVSLLLFSNYILILVHIIINVPTVCLNPKYHQAPIVSTSIFFCYCRPN